MDNDFQKQMAKMHDVILMYGIDNTVKEIRKPISKPKKQNKNDGKGKSLRDENGNIEYHIQTDRKWMMFGIYHF